MNNYINQPSEREFNHHRLQYRIAKDLIKDLDLENKEVLDFGGGNGEFSYFLKNNKNCNVEIFEPNINSQKAIKELGIKRVEELNNYDFIFMLDVIEHLIEPHKTLELLKEHLKPKGVIIITTPDCNYWKYRVKHLLGDASFFAYPHKHFSFFIKNNLLNLCRRYFQTTCIKKYPYTLGYIGMKEADLKEGVGLGLKTYEIK